MKQTNKNYKRFVSAMYVINIVAQAIFTLITPAALLFFISWLCVSRLGAPEWIYAVAIPLGVISGFISMVKFILAACANLDRLEKQNNKKSGNKHNEK